MEFIEGRVFIWIFCCCALFVDKPAPTIHIVGVAGVFDGFWRVALC
jgi:hypothetical protein